MGGLSGWHAALPHRLRERSTSYLRKYVDQLHVNRVRAEKIIATLEGVVYMIKTRHVCGTRVQFACVNQVILVRGGGGGWTCNRHDK